MVLIVIEHASQRQIAPKPFHSFLWGRAVVRGLPITSEVSPLTAPRNSASAVFSPSVAVLSSRNSRPCPVTGAAATEAGSTSDEAIEASYCESRN